MPAGRLSHSTVQVATAQLVANFPRAPFWLSSLEVDEETLEATDDPGAILEDGRQLLAAAIRKDGETRNLGKTQYFIIAVAPEEY